MVFGHECDSPVSVIIHDTDRDAPNIPVGVSGGTVDNVDSAGLPIFGDGVTVHERKDGPLSISRRAEVEIPLNAFGTDWFKYVNAFSQGGEMQRATVMMVPYRRSDYGNELITIGEMKAITGYIGGVGSNGANTGNLTIFGPYNLLSSVPVGVQINPNDGGLKSVMEWFTHRYEQGQTVFDNIEYDILGVNNIIPQTGVSGTKNFSANRDTLVDVAEWIRKVFSMRMWFEPDPDTEGSVILKLKFLPNTAEDFFRYNVFAELEQDGEINVTDLGTPKTYDATEEGDIDIIYNNALYEMKPYNTLVLRGTETHEPADPEDIALDTSMSAATPRPTGRYPEATARFPELIERSGGEMPVVRDVDMNSAEELANAAREQLKSELDTVSGGTMDLLLSPMISPHDKIIAQPACAGVLDTELPELTYEVQRVAHKVRPNSDDNEVYQSEVSVSMAVPAQEIEVETTLKDIQPAEDSDNRPSGPGEQFEAISYTS